MKISKLLKFRTQYKLSQMELAIAARVSTSMIVAVERYGYFPGGKVRSKLSQALGVSESEIWSGEMEAAHDNN